MVSSTYLSPSSHVVITVGIRILKVWNLRYGSSLNVSRALNQGALQWGSEIRLFEILSFEGVIANGQALAMSIAMVPTI